jgi:outer membrane protein insertion porin family
MPGPRHFVSLGLLLVPLLRTAALGAKPATAPDTDETPSLSAASPELTDLVGKPVGRIEVTVTGFSGNEPAVVHDVRIGEPFSPAVARRAARELLDRGGYADVRVDGKLVDGKAVLAVTALARRLVSSVRVEGGPLDDDSLLREMRIGSGDEITPRSRVEMLERGRSFYVRHGYPSAAIETDLRRTDDPMQIACVVRVTPGPERTIAARAFIHDDRAPGDTTDLAELEDGYDVGKDARADEESLETADRALVERIRAAGYYQAAVSHQLVASGTRAHLYVRVKSGPRYVTRFEGLRSFDASDLDQALDLAHEVDRGQRHLADKITEYYVRRGFLDAEVDVEERGTSSDRVHVIFFRVREHEQVRVDRREFPCIAGGPLSTPEARREIDSFLEEELPGAGLLGPVSSRTVDRTLGSSEARGARAEPLDLAPRRTYAADTYERALKHLQDYYRSQGYLSATVGPAALVRHACDRRSAFGQCKPLPLSVARQACLYDAEGLPIDEPPADPAVTCIADPVHGIACEPRVTLRIPIKLGPRTTLYDVAFDGNRNLVERELDGVADLSLGGPVSQVEVEAARRRVLDALREEGFAFAEVRAFLDFSPDRTRARARFVITEGERVVVESVIVRGARRTDPSLILRRVALTVCPRTERIEHCEPYRVSDVRKTEERIATLGTFSSVSVSLEDPTVPARRKTVLIDVQERVAQYLDLKPGFSTGEGFRVAIEYGHRNVGGEAIQLTLRTQLGYLPDAFILDQDVLLNYRDLTVSERLERRNTASILFPEIGLGPLFRLGLDGIDVRDNARDFGLTKEAIVATLTYRPVRVFHAQIGGSLEHNNVSIFRGGTVQQYLDGVYQQGGPALDLARLLLVPDGTTIAVAERLALTWDRRDNAFGATRGTLAQGSVEHVHAYPTGDEIDKSNPDNCTRVQPTSDFLKLTGTLSGYIRLTESGLVLAGSVRAGRMVQLMRCSHTYPDRLFFMGGVDSLRGFLQDSLVPQDVADKLLAPSYGLTINQVVIRGGDVFINPRLELRIPVSGIWETGIFVDSGNVWVDPKSFDPLVLRYAAGAGIRVATPIGPLAFDYGVNLIERPWENRGSFHFSIGLF